MEVEYEQLKDTLLPILQCTTCNCDKLELTKASFEFDMSVPLHREHILCTKCGARYPITEDFIPVMWTPSLQEHLIGQSEKISVLGANIELYQVISNHYQHSRQDPQIALRIRNSAKRIIDSYEATDSKYHLDLGCGPGHVLGWLKEFNFLQVGLDVSIHNLRNARRNTGAVVVCADAVTLPFADKVFDLVTESSVLHHVEDWKSVVVESCRICKKTGGVLIDSEPSKGRVAWGPLAIAVYNARLPVYKILSYIKNNIYFRDRRQTKLNIMAEFHAQPGAGLSMEELRGIFESACFSVDIIVSPTADLKSVANPNRKHIVMNLLSGRNPWNPKYGMFTAIAKPASG